MAIFLLRVFIILYHQYLYLIKLFVLRMFLAHPIRPENIE